jgi:hypothetical protein
MIYYVVGMLEEFPVKFKTRESVANPATSDMFDVGEEEYVETVERELFHRTTAKALFLCKRARPDIQPIVAVLCTRVKKPTVKDFSKLVRMMKYLNCTKDDTLSLSADEGLSTIEWFIDASFAVHPDFKSHTGASMRFGGGKGCPLNNSAKQKLNTSSSTTSELVAVDQVLPMTMWVPLFLEEQGHVVDKNVVYQDNKSAILLETNGKKSSGKRTRALNIRYFMVTDQVKRGNLIIKYCPTDDMIGDYMTKGVQGIKFTKFRNVIMGRE